MTTKLIGLKKFRQNMAKYSDEARRKKHRLIILKKNEPIFELKPLSKKDAAMERLLADIKEAQEDVKNGDVYSQEEMEKLFGLA